MVFEDLFKDLEERKKKAREMGGAEKVKRHHEQGKFTARERIEKMVDPGSFMEFGLLAHSDQPGMAERTPTDGLIMGYALVNGRRTGIIAHDFTVLASTNAEVNLRKLLQFKTQIKKYKVPLVFLGEAGGARIPDCQGSAGI